MMFTNRISNKLSLWICLGTMMIMIDNCSPTMATISQMIWPNSQQQQPSSINNSAINPAIRLNLIGQNQSMANAFTSVNSSPSLTSDHDQMMIDSLMINPLDIQFVVPNQPEQIGQQVVEQIRQQLGSTPISLGELKNKNMSFTLEMPGIQMNRTVETNISDQTIVRRRQGQYQLPSASTPIPMANARPFVVQTYMKKPNPNSRPVENVRVMAKPMTYMNYTAPAAAQAPYPLPVTSNSYRPLPPPPLPMKNYSTPQVPLPLSSPSATVYSGQIANYSTTTTTGQQQSPNLTSYMTYGSPKPVQQVNNTGAGQYNTQPPLISYERPKIPMRIYATNVPPLLQPKTDYSAYQSQTNSASYVNPTNNEPKIIYRYIEVCNGKPYDGRSTNNYDNMAKDLTKSAKTDLNDSQMKLMAAQSQMESSMKELEHARQMIRYYQNLVPQLNSYAQHYANAGSSMVMNPMAEIAAAAPISPPPMYHYAIPQPQSPYQQQLPQQTSYSGAAYSLPQTDGVYDGGNIKISYYGTEETYRTDNSSAIPAEIAIY